LVQLRVGCWANGVEPESPLARWQPHPALMAADEFIQIMKRKTSALAGQCLAASRRSLEQGIGLRKTMEKALKQSGKRDKALLKQSLVLQTQLRRLTHQILSGQEAERKKVSHELRDEIAQTLLGINVRLLTLKKAAQGNRATLKKEIASAQRLVQKSARSINKFARKLDTRGQA
jgi:signal transduction histidine kinase